MWFLLLAPVVDIRFEPAPVRTLRQVTVGDVMLPPGPDTVDGPELDASSTVHDVLDVPGVRLSVRGADGIVGELGEHDVLDHGLERRR